jgi:UDP-N-acetylmuramoyl-L-alanyl-D-glutamate--2,6-diaminopimelate ligase
MIKTIRRFAPQKAKNYFKHLPKASLALTYFRFPGSKLTNIGVTGTEGKTTTVNLIYRILEEAGKPTGMISTVYAKIIGRELETGLHVTSPDCWDVQRLLRRMADQGARYSVLEVTAHSLDQYRFFGIPFKLAVLTNLNRDHLDYFKTFENYREAKLKLLKRAEIVILNREDASFDYLSSQLDSKKIVTYGLKEGDFTLKAFPFKTPLSGDYNLYNCLAAIAATSTLGIPEEVIRKGVVAFSGVTGRLEEIKEGQGFRVFVDFAHTPNSLEQTLKTLKELTPSGSRLITVFGSAGQRDKEKRPMMGEAAAKYSDQIILTTDDPRDEKVEDICRHIARGIGGKPYKIIVDRRKAIEYAFSRAKKKDTVTLCGKGHEKTLAIGEQEIPWTDQSVAKEILRRHK